MLSPPFFPIFPYINVEMDYVLQEVRQLTDIYHFNSQ
jgi:hypothetical protein